LTTFCWHKKDEDDQAFADAVEALLYASSHKDHRARLNKAALIGHLNSVTSADDVIDLVFSVLSISSNGSSRNLYPVALTLGYCTEAS
jgi:hypothetical protein